MADLILAVHFAYVTFVVGGFAYIWIGRILGWRSARNYWFRVLHCCAMLIVVLEAAAGVVCPLTSLEFFFRGRHAVERSLMSRIVDWIMYYDVSEETFLIIYILFFLLLILSWFLVRPIRSQRQIRETP